MLNGSIRFVVANEFQIGYVEFQIGDVDVVRYIRDIVFHVLDLGSNYSEIQDNEDKNLSKKRLHSELPRKKKVKNIQEAEPVSSSSSSSSDNSCFLPLVTASSLCTDTLYLPLHFTSSNGFTRKCCKIQKHINTDVAYGWVVVTGGQVLDWGPTCQRVQRERRKKRLRASACGRTYRRVLRSGDDIWHYPN